jgi:hypothetical protein
MGKVNRKAVPWRGHSRKEPCPKLSLPEHFLSKVVNFDKNA